jgi:hypothetical protein
MARRPTWRSTRVAYRVNLDSPHEEIRLVKNYPGGERISQRRPAMLFRFGRPIAGFLISEGQLDKVADKRGRIEITQKQIDAYNHYAQPYGR